MVVMATKLCREKSSREAKPAELPVEQPTRFETGHQSEDR